MEARQEVNPIAREQALIQKHEVRFERVQEFQGCQTIRCDDDLVASLLCKPLTKPSDSGKIILDEKKLLYGGWFIGSPFHQNMPFPRHSKECGL